MNPQLARLQPYPFERLRALFAGVTPNAARRPINLSLGEPKHPTPPLILEALAAGAKGLANYPTTAGPPALREAIAAWLSRRHALRPLDPATQVLPVLGSREALFAFGQTVIDASRVGATVVVPNPFYQIYEGAAQVARFGPVAAIAVRALSAVGALRNAISRRPPASINVTPPGQTASTRTPGTTSVPAAASKGPRAPRNSA